MTDRCARVRVAANIAAGMAIIAILGSSSAIAKQAKAVAAAIMVDRASPSGPRIQNMQPLTPSAKAMASRAG